jgi:hypothetical protein
MWQHMPGGESFRQPPPCPNTRPPANAKSNATIEPFIAPSPQTERISTCAIAKNVRPKASARLPVFEGCSKPYSYHHPTLLGRVGLCQRPRHCWIHAPQSTVPPHRPRPACGQSRQRMSEAATVSMWWCGLDWSPWAAFSAKELKQLPAGPGVYRVRVAGTDWLAYVGETGRSVRGRLLDLRRNVAKPDMPFNDPHTAAPGLWAWARDRGFEYECSGASTTLSAVDRKGFECHLLWKHRVALGRSTLCNHGRFHGHYSRSRNRSTGIRGAYLDPIDAQPAEGPHYPALVNSGEPTGCDWMGLEWSPWQPLESQEKAAAVYRIRLDSTATVIYIGQTANLKERCAAHARRLARLGAASVSFATLTEGDCQIHRLEVENDLIGAFFDREGHSPQLQFSPGF